MGTKKMHHRRNRRGRARFAPFVAFALLFAFALGQGSSLVAFAFDKSGAGPTVSKDGSAPTADDSGNGGSTANGGTAKVSGSGPAAVSSGDGTDGTSSGGTGGGGGSAAAPEQQEPDEPGAPSGNGVQPVLLIGNQNCAEVLGDDLLFEYRDNSPADDTVDLAAVSGGLVEGTLTIDVHGNLVDFEIEGGDPLAAVVVKGGSNANLFDYRPDGETADTDLHAPLNPENDQFYGLSHISFCWAQEVVTPPVPAIDVEKTCPATVPAGQPISYTITVENTGEEALVDVSVEDALLGGDITDEFDFDFTGPFPEGEVATATISYTPGANEDPVENTVTASGTGAESDSDTSDDDSCTVEVIQGPAIAVSKECPAVVDEGDTITYEITVSNTGNEDLTGVTVEDSVIGNLSASYGDTLAVGASETHSFDHTAGSPGLLTNTVTVSGSGSEETVTATDECTTEIVDILGGGPTQPPTVAPTAPPGPGTAFTGSEAGRLGLIAALSFGIGLTVLAATRRRRSGETT
jgi:uncharacterized repeat protein (TIGR01451 family)